MKHIVVHCVLSLYSSASWFCFTQLRSKHKPLVTCDGNYYYVTVDKLEVIALDVVVMLCQW